VAIEAQHTERLTQAAREFTTQYGVRVMAEENREWIEVFEFDARGKAPTLTWIGCAIAPDPIGLNSVVGLPDGGFITTNFSSDEAAYAVESKEGTGVLPPGGIFRGRDEIFLA